jgi:hypothetical protein
MARKFLREAQLTCRDGEPLLAVSLEGVRSVGAAEPDGTMSSSRGCKGLQLSKSITALKERENLTTALAREIFGLTGIFPKPFF